MSSLGNFLRGQGGGKGGGRGGEGPQHQHELFATAINHQERAHQATRPSDHQKHGSIDQKSEVLQPMDIQGMMPL